MSFANDESSEARSDGRQSNPPMPIELAVGEIKSLQRCINDLVSVLALPAIWTGADPSRVANTLLDALVGMLQLDFAYARLREQAPGTPTEMLRVASARSRPDLSREIGEAIDGWSGDVPENLPPGARLTLGGRDISCVALRLGLNGEEGFIVAGSERTDFPRQAEGLLLSVAVNQAVIGLQEARLRVEHQRVADDLDRRVLQRTADLASANEELRREVAERRRAEEGLRAIESNFRQIVDSIPGLVCTLSPTGEVVLLNRRVLDYFGKRPEELKDWSNGDAVHPDDLPRVIPTLTHSLVTGVPYDIEHRCRRYDGVYRWFQVRALPVRDTDGCITGWYLLLTDIDDRKRAEDAIRASERDLNQIINAIPALAWSADPDGSADFFNQHYLDFVGCSAEEMQGAGWTLAVHPHDLAGVVASWETMMAAARPSETEGRLRRADGEYRWFLFRTNPLFDGSGTIVKWYGINTDIEDRKQAEEKLRRSEAFLVEGQRLSMTGSFSWRTDTDEVSFSTELRRIFEFERDTVVTLDDIGARVHPDDIPMLTEKQAEARRGGGDLDYEIRLRMPSGAVKRVHTIARKSRHRDGYSEFLGAVQEVTQRRLSEEALDKARSELAHVTRVMSLGTMTASIAHEVNQPLAGIITNASTCLRMLAADPPNIDGARETARRTIRDGHRASDVITRLRALFSKKQATVEVMDLNEATREVIALSLSELQRKKVVLRQDLADDLPRVSGDRVQIQQVILNLLLNASDAMSGVDDRSRELLIKTEPHEGDHVRVTVRDTGVGFESRDANELFEAFYTTKSNGMGIGLSVSRSIIEHHRGRLWAAPNDGPGATFSFSIPCGPEGLAS